MADSRKRQRITEDEDAAQAPISEYDPDPPSKKARKETNASARRTLFVRSLPAIANSDALTELFSQNYPLKHATVVMDTETKQSKGYGFVTFADPEDAQKAADEFNGQSFMGRKMRIEIAQPRSRDVATDGVLGAKKKSTISAAAGAMKKARLEKLAEDRKSPKLIIRNLPWSIKTTEQLAELFKKFGKVKHSTLPKVKDTQAGFGFVVMRGKKNAEKALAAVNGITVDGRMLAVDWAVEKEAWEKQNKTANSDEDEDDNEDEGGAKVSEAADVKSDNEEDDVANFFKNFGDNLESEDEDEEAEQIDLSDEEDSDADEEDEKSDAESWEDELEDQKPAKTLITDNSTTLFVRNLPFTTLDPDLKEHFEQFGPVRYARVVMDRATGRPRGTGFVCFFKVEDADACYQGAPLGQPSGANAIKKGDAASKVKHSLLQDEQADKNGMYTIEGRVLSIAKAVEKETAVKLTEEGSAHRDNRDKDKRKLFLLSEGTIAAGTPLYESLAPSEVTLREDSAKQRKKLIQNNPTLHLSLTRLSIRNLPKNITSADLKAMAREAVVGFAKDVKSGLRAQLSKEEEDRGGAEAYAIEKQRKSKGKSVIRQAKIVFEGREGAKVSEKSGAGRSRGYGFIEYTSHRWALMGLRWLNGHSVENGSGKKQRLIVEFAIENAQVVSRRNEREEKARIRSKEVMEAREKGEAPPKSKKPLRRDTVMAKTRKGMKGKKGRPEPPQKSFDKVLPKRKNEDVAVVSNKKAKKAKKSDAAPPAEDEKVAKRGSIIQKKRMLRRKRKQGA
ncbi:putative RNA-binding protein [Lachnellula suecica]|uniref:Putative RNA-binding protein n=1 Tax=Lachnellula suecica TaxID=602035 RepID=A0A8T9CN66_9HELO|nr:putative RNA-binding protein [Lachnellula suecica]